MARGDTFISLGGGYLALNDMSCGLITGGANTLLTLATLSLHGSHLDAIPYLVKLHLLPRAMSGDLVTLCHSSVARMDY